MLTTADAREWLDRWDRQQEGYIADREERFTVIADVVAATVATDAPTVLDLGAGPGSLSARLLDRFPAGRVIAIDADPLLLGLARAAYSDIAGLEIVEHDLRSGDWAAALPVAGVDAVVSTTALHWLTAPQLAATYRVSAQLIKPGGVFVDGDHFGAPDGSGRIGAIGEAVERARAARTGVDDREDWAQWWDAVAVAPELAGLRAGREARPIDHSVPEPPNIDEHESMLRDAGFAEVGTVWQCGPNRVLVAIR